MTFKSPPGPANRSFRFPIAQVRSLQFILNTLPVLERYAKEYPDCFSLSQKSSPPVVYFYHPKAIEQLFTCPPEWFNTSSGKILVPILGYNSLLVLEGDRHRNQRKLLMPPFHGARIRTYAELISTITQEETDRWQFDKPFNVRAAMQKISLRIIMNVVFGISSGERYEELQVLLTSLLDSISSPTASTMLYFPVLQEDWGAWSPWGRFWRIKQKINSLLTAEIEQRRAEADRGDDILSLLLSVKDINGQSMTDEELRDELLTLLFAGHETTASAMSWGLYWVERLPKVKAKLRQELATISVVNDSLAVTKLEYLTATVRETLRIYPIVVNTFPRVAKQAIKIFDYWLEAGTVLFGSIYLTHRREDLYSEPNCFKPERFLSRQYSSYEYLPFGGGSRRCIGYALALLEMKLVLANVFSQFELKRVGNKALKPVRRGVTLAPPSNMQMIATKI